MWQGTASAVVWLRRYGLAEVIGTAAAVVAFLSLSSSGHAVAAIAAAIVETAGFYGVMVTRELRGLRPLSGRKAALALAGLAVEFGPAEGADLVIRPAALMAAAAMLPSPAWR